MKFALIGLILTASGAQAESLCGVTDAAVVFGHLQGDWTLTGAISVETETLSVVEVTNGTAQFMQDRAVILTHDGGAGIAVSLGLLGAAYDVNGVDDILETVEAEWIADAVSTTPCGPDGLLQLSATSNANENETSRVTVVPYFSDKVVVIIESELTGDWGLGFITIAALLIPE